MNDEELFEGWRDSRPDVCGATVNYHLIKQAFLAALVIGLKAEREAITNNSFGQHHYQRGYKDGMREGMEEAAEIAENIDPVEVSGYYAQLGDASATKSNIVAAIRRRIEEGG